MSDSTALPNLAALRSAVAATPQDYEAHIALIAELRASHHYDELRAARECLASLFPLPESQWSAWLNDELDAVNSLEDQERVLALFDTAVRDYLSPTLWLRYTQFACDLLYDASDVQLTALTEDAVNLVRIREIYERGSSALLYHRLDSESFHRQYRQFETGVLTAMLTLKQQQSTANDSDTDSDDEIIGADDVGGSVSDSGALDVLILAQLDRIKLLYSRSLSAPVNGIEQCLSAYSQWVKHQGYTVEKEISQSCQRAKQMREERTSFEQSLAPFNSTVTRAATDANSDSDGGGTESVVTGVVTIDEMSGWMSYIRYEVKQSAKSNPALITVLFERALQRAFLHSDLWLSYAQFVNDHCSGGDHANGLVAVYERAVRNISHSSLLWCHYLRALDSHHRHSAEIIPVFKRALTVLSARGGSDVADLHFTMALHIHRQHDTVTDTDKAIRSQLKSASTALRYHDPIANAPLRPDAVSDVYSFWSWWERSIVQDSARADAVMEAWLELSSADADPYSEWARQLIERNEIEHARSIFQRGFAVLKDSWLIETIAVQWLRFEQRFGTIKQLQSASRQCEQQLQLIATYRAAAVQSAPTVSDASQTATTAEASAAMVVDDMNARPKKSTKPMTAKPSDKHNRRKRGDPERKRKFSAGTLDECSTGDDVAESKPEKLLRQSEQHAERKEPSSDEVEMKIDAAAQPTATAVTPTPETAANSNEDAKQSEPCSITAQTLDATLALEPRTHHVSAAAESALKAEIAAVDHPSRAFLIERLSFFTSEATLRAMVEASGVVESISVTRSTGLQKSHAVVTMQSKDACTAAIKQLNDHVIDGNRINVHTIAALRRKEREKAKEAKIRSRNVFLKQLPPINDLEAAIRDLFHGIGGIQLVKLVFDSDSKPRSHGWVIFDNESRAAQAIKLDRSKLSGEHEIRIVADEPPKKFQHQHHRPSSASTQPRSRLPITQLSSLALVPRAVNTGSTTANPRDDREFSSMDMDEAPSQPLTSNAAFRALLH